MRSGKYLGKGKTFDVVLPARDALMLALLPYKVGRIAVKGADARPGNVARVEIALKRWRRAGLHCYRMEVVGPDGKPLPSLAQNLIAAKGQASADVPFALNDPKGIYTITVRDVASGVRAEATIRLQ